MKHVTILSGQTKVKLSPAQAYSTNVEQYRLTVNGQEVSLQQNQQTTLSSQEQITAYYGGDYTVTINTPSSRITHSGQMVEIEEKGTADGSHCGLCGDYNNDRRDNFGHHGGRGGGDEHREDRRGGRGGRGGPRP